ncbi:MAG: hypothetical protein F4X80_10360 [Chloroflexi bacterium]|nr:hypothetical protein [Chloroflexota bacterium]
MNRNGHTTTNESEVGGGVAPGIREAPGSRRRAPGHAMPPEARMRAVIGAIARHTAAQGYAPSMQEIMDETGFSSTSVVMYWLRRCEEAGLLVRGRRMARAVALTEAGRTFAAAPSEIDGLPLRSEDPGPSAAADGMMDARPPAPTRFRDATR